MGMYLNKTKRNSSIALALLTFSMAFATLTAVKGAPADDYRLQVGDWYVTECTVNTIEPGIQVGEQYKNVVSAINRSSLGVYNYGSVLFVDVYRKTVGSSTFTYLGIDGIALYNSTDSTLSSTQGYYYYGDAMLTGGVMSCALLNGGLVYVASQNAHNTTSGYTATSWDGNVDGTGGAVDDEKLVVTFETVKHAGISLDLYNWTGTEWDLIFANRLVDYSWRAPDNMALIIVIVVISIVGSAAVILFVLYKKDIIKFRK
jgi:hypothetical protein